ncbi:MAG: helix-turn-helix transcriptional regulator [Leptospiraceae bacterium]
MPSAYDKLLLELISRFGQDVKLYRENRGLRMSDAAEDLRKRYGLKIDQSYLSRIESGQVDIKLKHFLALADYLQLDISSLVASLTAPSGIEYIARDPYVFRSLIRLREELGPEDALQTLNQFFEWMEDYDSRRKRNGGKKKN